MRRTALFGTIERIGVSIHASVKDATSTPFYSVYNTTVSIHASVKDATLRELSPLQAYSVSIHASVKDATILNTVLDCENKFQSTHL